jgi:pyridoxamine 5'-phosphate oxidase
MANELWHLRSGYAGGTLDPATVDADPIVQFRTWFDEAVATGASDPNAMTLATIDAGGRPSARIVLLKEVDPRGFVFFTSYSSRKAAALAANPAAALVFYWGSLHRQVRVEGVVAPIASAESDAYFAVRPRESNLSAMSSPQSQPIAAREELEARVVATTAAWEGKDLVRPETWGGYRLVPDALEFWQGQPNRLHDRVRYERDSDGSWSRVRLAP